MEEKVVMQEQDIVNRILAASEKIRKRNEQLRNNPYIVTTAKDIECVKKWCDEHREISRLLNGAFITKSMLESINEKC